ncbi:deoxyribonuclease [Candidatus Endobugula sertula]|uniref:Deoxyribonuclease n=1 Tax=Candidatus Endobugula sertula TaxID=62101 RepID=A0A1D2QTA1_9GAMM|nr:deoxyribonuclease [Candidatus Endobugula sertula]
MSPHFFDSHCHFDFEVFDDTRRSLWSACLEKNIQQLLIPGIHPKQWLRAQAITEQYPGILMAAGIHPWWLASAVLPETEQWLAALKFPQCVALGECGLDAVIDLPLEKQQVVFEAHLQMAVEVSMPLIIHVRQAHNETLQLLKRYQPPRGGVIHGFSGSIELAKQYWNQGFHLGIGGSITYPRAHKTRKMVKAMPLASLLIETDSPDMPLSGYQGQPNSPLRIIEIAATLAELRQQSLETITEATTANSCRLFGR